MRFSPIVAMQLAGIGGTDISVCVSGSKRLSETQTGMSVPPDSARFRVSKFVQGERIALAGATSVSLDTQQTPALWLDLTGTVRLFGPPKNILENIDSSLRRWGVTARLALAATPGAAWALTYCQLPIADCRLKESAAIDRQSTIDNRQFDSLLIAALRLPSDVVGALQHLGIFTIGQLRKLPR